MEALDRLRRSLELSPIIKLGDYDYFVHPMADGVPAMEPALLEGVARLIAAMIPPDRNRLLTVEALGIPIATAVALRVGKPLTIVRKRRYGLRGEVEVLARTGYAAQTLYLNGVGRGDRVAFVDDVLSTGGTIRAVAAAVREAGAKLCDAVVVIDKSRDRAALERELGLRIDALVRVQIRDGRVVVL